MTIEPTAFREAMSRFASAVHIVTTDGPAGRRGVTATAVLGLSDEPATILVCLNAGNAANDLFGRNGAFAVNTLSADARDLAHAFAGAHPADKRFDLGRWLTAVTGAPLLQDALIGFDCRLVEARIVATHHVLVGEVAALREGPASAPLLYHARGYRLLSKADP